MKVSRSTDFGSEINKLDYPTLSLTAIFKGPIKSLKSYLAYEENSLRLPALEATSKRQASKLTTCVILVSPGTLKGPQSSGARVVRMKFRRKSQQVKEIMEGSQIKGQEQRGERGSTRRRLMSSISIVVDSEGDIGVKTARESRQQDEEDEEEEREEMEEMEEREKERKREELLTEADDPDETECLNSGLARKIVHVDEADMILSQQLSGLDLGVSTGGFKELDTLESIESPDRRLSRFRSLTLSGDEGRSESHVETRTHRLNSLATSFAGEHSRYQEEGKISFPRLPQLESWDNSGKTEITSDCDSRWCHRDGGLLATHRDSIGAEIDHTKFPSEVKGLARVPDSAQLDQARKTRGSDQCGPLRRANEISEDSESLAFESARGGKRSESISAIEVSTGQQQSLLLAARRKPRVPIVTGFANRRQSANPTFIPSIRPKSAIPTSSTNEFDEELRGEREFNEQVRRSSPIEKPFAPPAGQADFLAFSTERDSKQEGNRKYQRQSLDLSACDLRLHKFGGFSGLKAARDIDHEPIGEPKLRAPTARKYFDPNEESNRRFEVRPSKQIEGENESDESKTHRAKQRVRRVSFGNIHDIQADECMFRSRDRLASIGTLPSISGDIKGDNSSLNTTLGSVSHQGQIRSDVKIKDTGKRNSVACNTFRSQDINDSILSIGSPQPSQQRILWPRTERTERMEQMSSGKTESAAGASTKGGQMG